MTSSTINDFSLAASSSELVVTLWQALTPAATAEFERFGGAQLQPSSFGDRLVLLKPTLAQAITAATTVWSRRFDGAAVVELKLPASVLNGYPRQCVAYEESEDFLVPVEDLVQLSRHIRGRAQVIQRFWREPDRHQCNFRHCFGVSLGTTQSVESFC